MSAETRKIDLVRLPKDLLTSYATGRRGTRQPVSHKPWPESELITVGAADPNGIGAWKATPGHMEALVKLDLAWEKAKGRRIRLTEVLRPYATVVEARAKYERWVAANRPTKPPAFDERTMKSAFVLPPNSTNHQWGGAVDLDVEAMCDDDEDLAELWAIGRPLGFRPIIAEPHLHQSEAWHFDHMGPLDRAYATHKAVDPAHAYAWVAQYGCILAGTFVGDKLVARAAQARLALVGQYVGAPDGDIGPITLKAATSLGLDVPAVARSTTGQDILNQLDAKGIGVEALGLF